jgi:antitoxin component YwqK of YwqJK toxin-antitoxin module
MKKLLPILSIFLIISCSKEVPKEQLVERNDVVYEVNSQTPFTGISTLFYKNGQLKERSSYKKGIKIGIEETFFLSGQLEFRKVYTNNGDIVSSEQYYSNGQLFFKKNYLDKDEKKIIEPLVEFFDNGQVKKISNLDKDKNGTIESYHSNGNLMEETEYGNGKKDGPSSIFDSTGHLKESSNYFFGLKTGVYKEFYNGKPLIEGQYLHNQRTGEWTFFYINGVVRERGKYKKDQRVGLWIENRESGVIEYKRDYLGLGFSCGKIRSYDKKGEEYNFSPESMTISPLDWKSYRFCEKNL